MKVFAYVTILLALIAQIPYSDQYSFEEELAKTTADRIEGHGYPVETHQVETEDNYVITMFRIPYSHKLQNQNQQRPTMFLFHGLSSSSDAWILSGPNDALAYVMADAGYDVWMGNARGNRYSRSNTRLSTRHPHFFRFSWHEVGSIDVPAMIDYIIEFTGETKIHYTGHSQGTTSFFVMTSYRPEYNEKIKTSHLLAPVAFMSNMTLPLAKYTRRLVSQPNLLTKLLEDTEWLSDSLFVSRVTAPFCNRNELTEFMCNKLATIDYDNTSGTVNQTVALHMNETHPAGLSTNQLLHYMQEYDSGHFRQYDWGEKENLKRYGQAEPPDYDISNISSELYFYYCTGDELADIRDVEYLASILPQRPHMHLVDDPMFDHSDFSTSIKVKEEINDRIIAACGAYEEAHRRDNDSRFY